MALNDRIRVVCFGPCNGRGKVPNLASQSCDLMDPCPDCAGTGRDAASEARLAELAEQLPADAAALVYIAPLAEFGTADIRKAVHTMRGLAAMLLAP